MKSLRKIEQREGLDAGESEEVVLYKEKGADLLLIEESKQILSQIQGMISMKSVETIDVKIVSTFFLSKNNSFQRESLNLCCGRKFIAE